MHHLKILTKFLTQFADFYKVLVYSKKIYWIAVTFYGPYLILIVKAKVGNMAILQLIYSSSLPSLCLHFHVEL